MKVIYRIIIVMLVLSNILVINTNAASGDIEKIENINFGGSLNDGYHDIIKTTDGYIAVGSSASTDKDLEGLNKGDTDAIIVKYDNDWNVVWNRNYGGSLYEVFYSVTVVSDGFVVAGMSNSSDGDIQDKNRGYNDGIIVKYDNGGNLVWNYNFGGSSIDIFYGVTTVEDGVIAVGTAYSNDYDLEGMNKGHHDAVIVKYDNEGNIVWNKNYGGSAIDTFYNAKLCSDGYIAVGYSYSTDQDIENMNKGDSDAIIAKYDYNGNVIFKQNFGGANSDTIVDIEKVPDGYLIVGVSDSEDQDMQGKIAKGSYDSMIAKYDEEFKLLWSRNFGGSMSDFFQSACEVLDSYIAVGYTPSTDYDLQGINRGLEDGIIVRYSKDGELIWKRTFGGTENDRINAAVVDDELSVIFSGISASNDQDEEGLNKGGGDAILGKVVLEPNLIVDIKYSPTEITDGPVTVTIIVNKPILTPEGWTKINDTTYTKEYTSNIEEDVLIQSLTGDRQIVKISINNIQHSSNTLIIIFSSIIIFIILIAFIIICICLFRYCRCHKC